MEQTATATLDRHASTIAPEQMDRMRRAAGRARGLTSQSLAPSPAATPIAQGLQTILTSPEGLTEQEAAARRARGESNAYRPATSRTYFQILRQHAFSFINTVLFGLGVTLVVLGRIDDAILTAGMVVLNVVMGVGQEGRAKHRLDKIALLTRPRANVIRDGRARIMDPAEIVLGDVLEVHPGDQIVVDGQVIGNGHVDVDESLLTGESDRVSKQAGDPVYSGSFCMSGSARYVAQHVGASSFANRMTTSAQAFRQVKTPLQRDVDAIVKLLVLLTTQLGILIGLSFLSKVAPAAMVERVQIAAVLAALVPQGLFAMTTVTYAMGALRIAGRGALIQQVNAVESLSNVNILCLDKTGTLTTNALKVREAKPLGTTSESELGRLLGTFIASQQDGNRTSEAIGAAFPGQARTATTEIPFSSAHKWSALSFQDDDLRGTYVLGAPEMMQAGLREGDDYNAMLSQIDEWASQGLRVLLFARTGSDLPTARVNSGPDEADLPGGLVPLGLVSLHDELRPEAQSTLQAFADAGVHVKIISGDNSQTVTSLARQAGVFGDLNAISGPELAAMSPEEFAQAAADYTVFGRVTPQQKEQLVRTLRAQGHYVAMIGDGVNDVLSLKQAQLAVAMQSGSQATRGVADIVLLDDSFAVLPKAVLEGQRIIHGMQDVMRLVLSHTFYVALLIVGTAIIEVAFPTTPKLRSLVTMLTVGIPTLFIAGWARPGQITGSVLRPVLRFVLPAGFTVAALGLGVYLSYMLNTGDVDLARSALTTTMMLCGVVLVPFAEPPSRAWVAGDELSGDWRPTLVALAALGVYIVVMLVQPFRDFLQLRPLPMLDWFPIAAAVGAWALALRTAWRAKLFERLISIELFK